MKKDAGRMGFSVSHGFEMIAHLERRVPIMRRKRLHALRGRQTRDQRNRRLVTMGIQDVKKESEADLLERTQEASHQRYTDFSFELSGSPRIKVDLGSRNFELFWQIPVYEFIPSNNITFGARPQIKLKLKTPRKYNESRLVDYARFNDETDNENHHDEIINEKRLVEKEIECASLTEKILIVNALTESNDNPKTSKSTKEREINHSKRKAKKSKSSGRNANKTSHSDENQALAREKNVLLRQIDFLNSIILDTKLKKSQTRVCLQHFGFSFAVVSSFLGWPTVKLKALASPLASPKRAMSPTGERSDEGTSELDRIRWDSKRGRRALTKQ
ncbi:hypothetical protein TNCV_4397941 [Trichonephila clavipes]|nr:hypothetical protein TNCV_4397941 [Trichonephila clavipes]